MLIKQSYIYAIVGAVIGLSAILMLNRLQSDRLSAQHYQRDFDQITAKMNALTDSMNSLTTLTLQLDKSFKQREAASSRQSTRLETESSNQHEKPVIGDSVNKNPAGDNVLNNNYPGPGLYQDDDNDGAAIADEWQIKQQETQLVSSFENHFSNQNTDTTWAQGAEQALQNALVDDIFSNSQLNSISCRATLCKIDTQHSDLDSELVFLEQINSRAGFSDTESFYTRDVQPDGAIVMTLYLSRDGHRLPRFVTTGDAVSG